MAEQRAVVLLSGGLDSVTTVAIARSRGFSVFALSVLYGQRHVVELDASRRAAKAMPVAGYQFMQVDLRGVGQSALTDDIQVPTGRSLSDMATGVPVTYVPAGNMILLSCALAYAESLSAFDIFIGVNALDFSGYPDCRPECISAFESLANLATRQGIGGAGRIRIHTPLIHSTKSEIIRTGMILGVDYANSSSCYQPDFSGAACGDCDACTLRLIGFADAGLVDPVRYVKTGGQ